MKISREYGWLFRDLIAQSRECREQGIEFPGVKVDEVQVEGEAVNGKGDERRSCCGVSHRSSLATCG